MQKRFKPLNKTIKLPSISELIKTNPVFFKSFYSSPVAKVLILHRTGKYIEVNKQYLKLFECKREQVIGKSPDELGLLANRNERKKIQKEYRKNNVKIFNFDVNTLKGNKKSVILSVEELEINGNLYLLGDHLDNTDLKDFENRLKQSEEQYKLLFYKNPLPMWIFDFDTLRFIAVNDSAIAHYGYSKKEFLKMKLTDIRPKEEVSKYRDYHKKLKNRKEQYVSTFAGIWKHKKKNGELIDVEITRTPVKFENKDAILILVKDVTSVLKAQENLRKKNEEIELVYNSAKEISSTLNPNEIYATIYKVVSRLIPANGMIISTFDKSKKLIICKAAWIKSKKLDISKIPEMPLDKSGIGIQSRAILSRKSIIVSNLDEYARNNKSIIYIYKNNSVKKKLRKTDKVNKSALVVPMLHNKSVIGVIQVFSYSANVYHQEHLQLLEALSAKLSAATANALLHIKAQNEINVRKETEVKLLRSSKDITNLYQISKDLSSMLNINELYDKINKTINRAFPECDIGISIFNEKEKTISLESLFIDDKKINTKDIPVIKYDEKGKGLQSSVIKSKKSRVIENYKQHLKKSEAKYYIKEDGSVSNKKNKSFKIAESALIVPLLYKGAVLGTIQLLNFSKKSFSEENIKMVEALASHVAVSYINAKLYQQAQNEINEKQIAEKTLKNKTEELQILYEAQQVLSGSLDIESIYDKIYKIIASNIPCDSMIISSYNSSDKMIRILSIWADGVKPDINIFPLIPLAPEGYGIQSEVIRLGKSKLINDYQDCFKKTITHFSYTNDKVVNIDNVKYHSAIIVPMVHENNIIGVIQLLSYAKNTYNLSNLNLMESLAGPITAATFNASLYRKASIEIEEKQKAREELALRNKEITLLYRTGRELLSTLDLEEIYEIYYRKVIEVIPCDSMIISEYSKKSNKIYCKAAWVENTKHNPSDFPLLTLGANYKGTQSEAIVTGNSVIINNFYEIIKDRKDKFLIDDEGNIFNSKDSANLINDDSHVTRSALYIPMKLGKNVIGVISVFSFKENAYSEYDLKILESISVNLSVAVANAELYKRAQIEISERIKKEDELKQIKKNLEEAQRIAHIGSWVFDKNTNQITNSEEVYRILGINQQIGVVDFNEAINCIFEEDKSKTIEVIKNAMLKSVSYENEDRIIRPDGEIRFVKVKGEPVYNKDRTLKGMRGTIQDITDIKKINDELIKSLGEKEIMLKEIHHRVKNNLQIVSSLLRLQADKIKDDTVVEYFKQSEQRIKSMALIHQQLYRTKDLSRINFREYLSELCSYLLFANDATHGRINLKLDAEELYFGIDTALPCGLIINELFTNAIKYAFPNGASGSIILKLYKDTDDLFHIMIKDDGIGATNLNIKNSSSLGMELVHTLTNQIEGEISITINNGTEINLYFKDSVYNKRF